MTAKINIAIDGYSSCGKGTLANFLAGALGYRFIDSGSMYRALTLFILRKSINVEDTQRVVEVLNHVHISFKWNNDNLRYEIHLNSHNFEKEIRSMEVASNVSKIAKIPEVRSFLVAQQRAIAWEKGVVMDGRDIGTVVIPDAELKIFMTARPEVRAERRLKELLSTGLNISYKEVLSNLEERDRIDSTREDSPLLLTKDYKVLDNSDMDLPTQNKLAMEWVKEVFLGLKD